MCSISKYILYKTLITRISHYRSVQELFWTKDSIFCGLHVTSFITTYSFTTLGYDKKQILCLPVSLSSILVFFNFGQLPFWLSSIMVRFHFCRILILLISNFARQTFCFFILILMLGCLPFSSEVVFHCCYVYSSFARGTRNYKFWTHTFTDIWSL